MTLNSSVGHGVQSIKTSNAEQISQINNPTQSNKTIHNQFNKKKKEKKKRERTKKQSPS